MALEADYLYDTGDGPEGPVPESAIRAMVEDGRLHPDTRVKSDAMLYWVPVGTHPAFRVVGRQPLPGDVPPTMAPTPAGGAHDGGVVRIEAEQRRARYTQTYVATAVAGMWKTVTCVHCSCEWVYYLELEGSGSGTTLKLADSVAAIQAAEAAARVAALTYVRQRCAVIPCPHCNVLQPEMVAQQRRDNRADNGVVAIVAAIICLITAAIAAVGLSVLGFGDNVALWGGLAVGLAVARSAWSKRARSVTSPNVSSREVLAAKSSVMRRDVYEERRNLDGTLPALNWASDSRSALASG